MKILNKLLLAGVFILSLASCNNNNDLDLSQNNENVKGDTHVGVTLTMALPGSTRTLPTDFNFIGEWAGQDLIENIAIYIVDDNIVSTGLYGKDDFNISSANSTNDINITPKKAIKSTPGSKRIYALINASKEVREHLANAEPKNFENAYKEIALKLANGATEKTAVTSASQIAQISEGKDVILMTNSKPSLLKVEDGVDEAKALAGAANRARIEVQRAVARVMVTTAQDSFEVKNNDKVIGTVSNITWVLAQGENSLFVQQKENLQTPAYDKLFEKVNYYTEAGIYYDYSGLREDANNNGTTVAKLSHYAILNEEKDNKDAVLESLGITERSVQGKFILPTTHKYGADQGSTGYRKGNTPYVLIRAKFTPKELADGQTYQKDKDFYMGANGLFYSSKENAQNPKTNGIEGQKVSRYLKGKVLYYAWVNPDKVPGWLNSPVLRNNIYHVQIKGFKNIGTNWNPLVPNNPKDPEYVPKDPTDPYHPENPNNPNNPDSKPSDPSDPDKPNPDEPENPIDPEDPLTQKETWMSVEMSVIPWKIHSYEVELSI